MHHALYPCIVKSGDLSRRMLSLNALSTRMSPHDSLSCALSNRMMPCFHALSGLVSCLAACRR